MVDSFASQADLQSLEMRRFRDGSWPGVGNTGRCSGIRRAALAPVAFLRDSIVLRR
jgi:hypothetical protein